MSSKVICLHHTDLDGICSAAIVNIVYTGVDNYPMNYGIPLPWDVIKDNIVIMVDFHTDDFDDMIKIQNLAEEFIWIDHHATAIDEYLKRYREDHDFYIEGKREVGQAGCELTWQYFKSTKGMPRAVRYLGRWDVWDHGDPCFDWFQYGMRTRNYSPTDPIWECLFQTGLVLGDTLIKDIMGEGQTIIKYRDMTNQQKIESYGFITTICEHTAIACNTQGNSQLFDSVWDVDKYDLMLIYNWSPKANKYRCSMYTEKEDVNVGEIAKSLGGGGHKNAAGFTCDTLPFAETSNAVGEK